MISGGGGRVWSTRADQDWSGVLGRLGRLCIFTRDTVLKSSLVLDNIILISRINNSTCCIESPGYSSSARAMRPVSRL